MGVKKNALEAEWSLFQKKEENFLASREVKKDSYLNQKLADKVPAKLQGQLDKAFAKAFGMVFEKGTDVIEKTYKKEELQKGQCTMGALMKCKVSPPKSNESPCFTMRV